MSGIVQNIGVIGNKSRWSNQTLSLCRKIKENLFERKTEKIKEYEIESPSDSCSFNKSLCKT